ncbi:hypothetical protein HRbin17_02707 [bacterium HR17]|uniref:Uncharacterized protein n=1 Tax=Candidatus Fervidibacter japonicus TaxID=2035412 RepID=A0A2H5XG64_9BACT|nr:hypothetical protein HRbin17_02707 [bacterium HR17]
MPQGSPSLTGAILLLVMMALVITALLWEVMTYARRRSILTPARFVWRLVGFGLLLSVFAGMFAGLYLIRFSSQVTAIRYWTVFLMLAPVAVLALVIMAVQDWRWLMGEQMRRRAELYRQLGDELRQMAQNEPQGDSNDA